MDNKFNTSIISFKIQFSSLSNPNKNSIGFQDLYWNMYFCLILKQHNKMFRQLLKYIIWNPLVIFFNNESEEKFSRLRYPYYKNCEIGSLLRIIFLFTRFENNSLCCFTFYSYIIQLNGGTTNIKELRGKKIFTLLQIRVSQAQVRIFKCFKSCFIKAKCVPYK